jgi:tetratricopeptide (TPR) repeat protein
LDIKSFISIAITGAMLVLSGCGEPEPDTPEAFETTPAPAPEPAALVGSAACAECHAEISAKWRDSHHARAMQKATAGTALGDFAGASFRDGGTTWTFERDADALRVRSAGSETGEYEVAYTLGVDPLQQLLIPLPDGRLQPLHVAWDARPAAAGGQRWFSLLGDERVAAGEPAHWKSPAQSANGTCAECHTTGFRKGFDVAANRYDSTWSEAAVGCEACHGAGSQHVAWARAGARGAQRGLEVAFAKSTAPGPNPEIETCAPCHSQRARIAEPAHAGDAFLDGYTPALLESGLYHDDGQVAGEVYEWGSFVQSTKYAAGVRCSDCHEPHTGRLRAEGDASCASCHDPARFAAPEHHHHPATATPACVDCHMPEHEFLSVSAQRDHGFHVPRPDLSVAIGTPNACGACHAKRGDAWAAKAVESWRGSAAPRAHFAARLHARTQGGSAAGRELEALVGDDAAPAIARATALIELGGVPQRALIERAAQSPDPLLRLAAARTAVGLELSDRVATMGKLLGDTHRAVRIEAANVLADVADDVLTDAQRTTRSRAQGELRAAQAIASDSPGGQVHIARLLVRQGDLEDAEAAYLTALRLGDYHPSAYVGLTELYEAQERVDEALALLNRGIERVPEPDSAELHFAKGVLHGGRDETEPALRELSTAARLAPHSAYFTYVYAVALNEAGRARDALAALRTAVARHPADQNLLGATALIARDSGRLDEALTAAKRLVELFPDQPEPQALVEEIEDRRLGRSGAASTPLTPAPVTAE